MSETFRKDLPEFNGGFEKKSRSTIRTTLPLKLMSYYVGTLILNTQTKNVFKRGFIYLWYQNRINRVYHSVTSLYIRQYNVY